MAYLVITDERGEKHEYRDVPNDFVAEAMEAIDKREGTHLHLAYTYPDGTTRHSEVAWVMFKVVDFGYD
ncbi:hypothetical protein L1280_002798 [Deinococcus sp. HSC-46F16]|uniref:hypothetical protein n=1 Tax=Deinococcus sp. HSC-46F16 TaxID=2910968 RepID=UPI0020A04699|nr:hypothetical protein [Deinococcus sp. HSC-46F16]MCP2015630.1 hypothetical protein [Deinococcus sp. HSC-46F16]